MGRRISTERLRLEGKGEMKAGWSATGPSVAAPWPESRGAHQSSRIRRFRPRLDSGEVRGARGDDRELTNMLFADGEGMTMTGGSGWLTAELLYNPTTRGKQNRAREREKRAQQFIELTRSSATCLRRC